MLKGALVFDSHALLFFRKKKVMRKLFIFLSK
jgi:hypothetical protein